MAENYNRDSSGTGPILLTVWLNQTKRTRLGVLDMKQVSQLLDRIDAGDPSATDELFPLVYDQLRHLAGKWLADEKVGQTLQPTALVHKAYLRLLGNSDTSWQNRAYFFAAAATAMRRILVENARRKKSLKRGGGLQRAFLHSAAIHVSANVGDRLDLECVLAEFDEEFPAHSRVVQLRFFSGLSHDEVDKMLGISVITAKRYWRFARVWLHRRLVDVEPTE